MTILASSGCALLILIPPPHAAENPVLPLSKEDYAVVAPSDTRSSVVTDFLTSEEFVEVIPEGITIPSGSDDGSVPLMVSMVTILGTVIFALLV